MNPRRVASPRRSARSRRARTRVALLLAGVALAGCTATAAPGPAPPPYEPHPATAIVDRLADEDAARVPDVMGLTVEAARRALAAAGTRPQVVAFDEGPVSAQYPEAGARPPDDGRVVVWTGTPPEPEPPPPPPEPSPEPAPTPSPQTAQADDDRRSGDDGDEAEREAAPSPQTTAAPSPPAASDPTPARTSPRRMEPLEPGTVLEGLASWYGPGFAGRTTACGGTFDPDALTLATRELRCGTRVLVTGPDGRTVEAVATDWGPAEWTGRRFDLSRATFAAVHPLSAGVASMTVEVLP